VTSTKGNKQPTFSSSFPLSPLYVTRVKAVEDMGGPYRRKKYHYGDTHLKKGWRVKRRTKDLDQVREKWPSSKWNHILYEG